MYCRYLAKFHLPQRDSSARFRPLWVPTGAIRSPPPGAAQKELPRRPGEARRGQIGPSPLRAYVVRRGAAGRVWRRPAWGGHKPGRVRRRARGRRREGRMGVSVIPGSRILLSALLVLGSVGSSLCQVGCAGVAASPAVAHAGSSEAVSSDHSGCHGRGTPSPEPLSERSPEPCREGCCAALTHGAVAPTPVPGPAPAASPVRASVDLDQVHTRPALLRESPPAECLESPFHFRNPPLLI